MPKQSIGQPLSDANTTGEEYYAFRKYCTCNILYIRGIFYQGWDSGLSRVGDI